MATTLPREIIKWIQTLDLSYAIKNFKRDFANGFLFAEILSKYYPADVQMHAFDTGTGAGAKRNNWGMLERIFARHSIPVTKEICVNVAACQPKSAGILISIVYWHLNNKAPPPDGITASSATLTPHLAKRANANGASGSNAPASYNGGGNLVSSGNGSFRYSHGGAGEPGAKWSVAGMSATDNNKLGINVGTVTSIDAGIISDIGTRADLLNDSRDAPSTADIILSSGRDTNILAGTTINPFQSQEPSTGGTIHTTVKTAHLLLSQDNASFDTSQEGFAIGTVSCMRVICQVFGVTDQQVNFHRNGFATNLVRDILAYKIESKQRHDPPYLMSLMNEKTPELMAIIQQSPPIDFQLMFDTIIPCIVNYTPSTKVFQAMSTILCYIGDLCQRMLPTGESYRRLSSARDFVVLVQQISLPTMDKIPFVAKILHAFLGTDLQETERVRAFLEIKSIINKEKMHLPMVQSKSSSGSEFIFFLAAFNAMEERPSHSAHHQFTVFHLSECLTIMNAYKGTGQGSALLLSSMNVPAIASDITSNPGVTILSTADLPSLEVAAALHIVAAVVRSGVPLQHPIMTDVVDAALRIFFKPVINQQSASHLQKAYVDVVVSLMETLPIDQSKDSVEYMLLKELSSIMSHLLKWFSGESLRAALIMTAPILFRHQRLCTPFVRGLMSVGDAIRVDLLKPPDGKNSKQILSWELPFLSDETRPHIYEVWWPFGITMGVCKSIEYSRSPLEGPQLQIMCAATRSDKTATPQLTTTGTTDCKTISQSAWNHLFLCLADHIIASMAVHELSDLAWNAFTGFIRICSRDTFIKKFPALLAILVYVHTADRGRCRRRIVARLKRWAARDPLILKPGDGHVNGNASSSTCATIDTSTATHSAGIIGVLANSNTSDGVDTNATGNGTSGVIQGKEEATKWPEDLNDAHAVHLEAKRVLRIFHTEFPTLASTSGRPYFSC